MNTNLRILRKNAGMTQEELANAVNATKRQIGAWERGENDLPLDFASAIADVFGCTLDELAGTDNRYVELTAKELEIIDIMRGITVEGQKQLMIYARGVKESYPKNHQLRETKTA